MGRNITGLAVFLGLFALCACAGVMPGAKAKTPALYPAKAQDQRPSYRPVAAENSHSDGSLWKSSAYRGLFKDLRAHQVGDLVTVNIVETSRASKKATTKTGRQSSIDAGITNALGWESKIKNLTSFGKEKVRGAFSNDTMFKANMKNDFNGSGETTRDENMTASITAVVVDVAPNGNLLIRGTREVRVNNENQVITLTGMVRPEDISPDNTVLSSYIADARIAYSGRGPVSDKQRAGWLMRAVDFVWPF